MERTKIRWIALICLATLLIAGLGMHLSKNDNSHVINKVSNPLSMTAISDKVVSPLPQTPALPAYRLALGEKLFMDTRLSADDTVACATCHDLSRGGIDGRKFSQGVAGALGDINAPTVFNSSLSFSQFWNGRAGTLEEQAAGPIHNPLEMAANWEIVLPKLRSDPDYREMFARAYKNGITPDNILDAIATFERSLLTPDSPFDQHLRGEGKLDPAAIAGYQRFLDLGCAACHQGVLLGGNMYQKFGVLRDYYQDRKATTADLGRFNVTGREEDRHVFKVPGLRNVALTAPYFHDGSAATLEEAVLVMGRYQLGQELAAQDIHLLVAFLRSLTGQWQGKTLQ